MMAEKNDKLNPTQLPAVDDSSQLTLRFMLMMACFVIIIAGMKAAVSIIVPFLLSLFIAVIATPFLFWMQKKRIPVVISIIILSLIIVAIGAFLVTLISATLADFSSSLPSIQQKLQTQMIVLLDWLNSKGIDVSREVIEQYVNIGSVMQLFSNMVSQLTSLFANGFLIFLTVVFILLEMSVFPEKLRVAFKMSDHAIEELSKFTGGIKRYLAIKTITSLSTGLILFVWLYILGVGYPLLWGLLAFILNFVPNIGSIIAAIPPTMLALIQFGPSSALLTAGGYLVVNTIIGNIIEPRWMGKGLGLSTLVVFLSLVFWGWVFGPVGMLLSVPLTMIAKVVLANRKETRWLAVILDSEAPKK